MRKLVAILSLLAFSISGSILGYILVTANYASSAELTNEREKIIPKQAKENFFDHGMPHNDLLAYCRSQPIYIFLNEFFMGKYDNDGWHSLDGEIFYFKDIVVAPSFHLYNMTQYFGAIDTVGWDIADGGLGRFGSDSATAYTPTQQKAMQKLTGKTQQEVDDGNSMGYIKLPITVKNHDLRSLTIPYYNAYQASFGDYARNYEQPLDITREPILVFNATHDPRVEQFKSVKRLSEEHRDYFLEKLRREGMSEAPLTLTDHYQFDADNDGKTEHIVILQNSEYVVDQSERGKKQYGLYTYAFYIDEEKIQEIYERKLLCTSDQAITSKIDVTALTTLTPLGIYDLNNNGKLEFCVQMHEWESGAIIVYALNDNDEYEEVLRSRYGM